MRHEVGAGGVDLLDDRRRVGVAVGQHVQHHALGVAGAERLAQLLLLLGRLAVVGEAGLGEADRLGERVAAVEPGLLIRVGLVADLADELDVLGCAGAGVGAGVVPVGLRSAAQPARASAASAGDGERERSRAADSCVDHGAVLLFGIG